MSKQEVYTTPVGIAMWPKLTEPTRRFKPLGVFEVFVRYGPEEGEKLKEELNQALATAHAEFVAQNPKKKKLEVRPMSIRPVMDEEGNETGELDFKFSMAARVEKDGKAYDMRPLLVDAKGTRVKPEGLNIGNGSKVRVKYALNAYNNTVFGLSMKLKAVQIIDRVEYTGGVGEFDPVEGGWTQEGIDGGDEEKEGQF